MKNGDVVSDTQAGFRRARAKGAQAQQNEGRTGNTHCLLPPLKRVEIESEYPRMAGLFPKNLMVSCHGYFAAPPFESSVANDVLGHSLRWTQ
jgi:hypothetical protein